MRRWRLPAALLVVALLVGALLPALANIVPDDRTVPRIAVVARGDNPIDALSSAPIAGATGGIVVLTVPAELTQPAADALKAFAPDVVILAGGTAALSEQVRAQVAALGSWEVRRVSGADRYLTAGALATVLADYGLDGLAVSDAVPAHAKTVYVQDTGDEATNGAALRAAAATITAPAYGWRIVLDPGRYDVGTETLVLPSEIEVVGAGRSLTKIVGTVTAAAAVREAAVVAGEPGGHLALRALTVENLGSQAGTAAAAVFCDGWLEIQDAEIGQNTNKTDDDNSASYGIVSRGGFWIRGFLHRRDERVPQRRHGNPPRRLWRPRGEQPLAHPGRRRRRRDRHHHRRVGERDDHPLPVHRERGGPGLHPAGHRHPRHPVLPVPAGGSGRHGVGGTGEHRVVAAREDGDRDAAGRCRVRLQLHLRDDRIRLLSLPPGFWCSRPAILNQSAPKPPGGAGRVR
jgi:hypothetical protein